MMYLFAVVFLVTIAVVSAWINNAQGKPSNLIQSKRLTPLMMLEDAVPDLCTEPPRKILLLVEPTPFNYVSGYANRFQEMLKFLKRAGDDVRVVTADSDPNPPTSFLEYPIATQRGFELPMYKQVTCTFDFGRRIQKIIKSGFNPDLIHVSTPSAIVYPAVLWAYIHDIPLVMSYHTDFVGYAKAYVPFPQLSVPIAESLLKIFHHQADLVLCTSPQLKTEMENLGIGRIDVWQKGINTEIFNPKFRDEQTRYTLTDGHVGAPLLLYVGRIGAEKKLERLKKVLDANPDCRLAIVGKGPTDQHIREFFKGYPVHFAGQLTGEALSKAFASADIFVMPSDTETLGFVVMEAMASGVPVVGVAAGGLVDIIQHESAGFLAENNEDMEDFAQRVRTLVADPTMRQQFAVNAVQWAQGWSWETATSKLRNIQYRKAISLHRSRGEGRRHHPEITDLIMQSTYNTQS